MKKTKGSGKSIQVLFDFKVALDQHAIVAITDAPGKITYVNDRFCAISKYSREELIGQDHRIINSGHHSKAFFRKLWQTIMSGRTWRGLIKSRAKDGTFYWLDTTIVPFLDASGKPAQYITIRTDTTAREQAAERIRQLNQDLRQKAGRLDDANRELEAFSYSVSHDLRAPLRHLEGFLALLESHIGGGLDEKGQHYLDTLLDSARQMGNLIDALLRFSRTGRVDMSSTKVGMADLVEQVLRELTADLRGRKIVWTVAPLPEVTGDPALLRQVLVNLLDNAIKYTRTRAEATIEIGCREEGEEWVFFVRDNGVGFDMRYVHKLFGVFQRLHGSGEFEGTGIGLATVQRIVGRHGGRAWAEGVVDHGATFYVSLPKWLSGEKDRFGREPAESITDREEQPS